MIDGPSLPVFSKVKSRKNSRPGKISNEISMYSSIHFDNLPLQNVYEVEKKTDITSAEMKISVDSAVDKRNDDRFSSNLHLGK